MVSWVPGSPIDWAAMTPTASPALTSEPDQVAAVALGAQTVAGIAGKRGAHLDFIDPQLVDQINADLRPAWCRRE
jgi:hypothetical protein